MNESTSELSTSVPKINGVLDLSLPRPPDRERQQRRDGQQSGQLEPGRGRRQRQVGGRGDRQRVGLLGRRRLGHRLLEPRSKMEMKSQVLAEERLEEAKERRKEAEEKNRQLSVARSLGAGCKPLFDLMAKDELQPHVSAAAAGYRRRRRSGQQFLRQSAVEAGGYDGHFRRSGQFLCDRDRK
ncbi:hypothetical protein ACFE04_011146 [Oxalis oulophora]